MQFVQKFILKENKNWFPRWVHARVRKIDDKWIKITTDIPVNITQKNWRLQTRNIVKSIKYVPSTGKTNIYNFHVSDVAKQVQRQAKITHPSMQ